MDAADNIRTNGVGNDIMSGFEVSPGHEEPAASSLREENDGFDFWETGPKKKKKTAKKKKKRYKRYHLVYSK